MDGETRVDPNAGWSTLKEIPLDATEFTANGKTFRVYKSVSQDRWAEYETLTDEIGFARTFDQIRNEVKGCIDILDSITKNGKGFVDLSVKLNDLYTGTRTNLGLGTLATQSGTFSGTSSGTNTGDQTTIVGITGTLAEFNTSLTGADFATGGGTATGTNTGDQTSVTGNAGTATALQTGRTINGVTFDGTANIVTGESVTPFLVRAATPFPYTNLPAAANFFQDVAPPNVFPCHLAHATQARIYVYTATTGSAGSKLSIRYKTGAWSSTAGDYVDIGTSEVACTVNAANTFTDSGWINLAAGAKTDVHVSVFGLGGNGTADPTFNILGVQFR
jgi:hypothetical protein